VTTNRTFDVAGNETNIAGRNTLAIYLFGPGALSPVDRWTFELPLAVNPFLRSVTSTDLEEQDLSEIDDAVLALEYETGGT
jgi:hypothetical protein